MKTVKKKKAVKKKEKKNLTPKQLFDRNMRLATIIASKYWYLYPHRFRKIGIYEKLDVEQEALIGLNNASKSRSYDSSRDFSTYAMTFMRNYLKEILKGAKAKKRQGKVTSINDTQGRKITSLLKDKGSERRTLEMRKKILKVVQNHPRLRDSAKRRFIEHYGLTRKNPMSMGDIAKKDNVTLQNVTGQMRWVRKILAENTELRKLFERTGEK